MVRILVADDHAVVRQGVIQLLRHEIPGVQFDEAANAFEAVSSFRTKLYDLAILDLNMPGASGLELIKTLKAIRKNASVLIFSMHPEDQIAARAIRSGAMGYVSKSADPDELVEAVKRALSGMKYVSPNLASWIAVELERGIEREPHERLSDREYDIFRRLAAGQGLTEIGNELALSPKTVSTYRSRILEKMGLRTNADLTQYAMRHGLI